MRAPGYWFTPPDRMMNSLYGIAFNIIFPEKNFASSTDSTGKPA